MKKLKNTGFDIALADAISVLELTKEEVQQLGDATAKRRVASAKIGHQTYYREATLRRMFNR